jgi:hypothetical protein
MKLQAGNVAWVVIRKRLLVFLLRERYWLVFAQALIACGCIKSARQPPNPPAFATSIASEAGQAARHGSH